MTFKTNLFRIGAPMAIALILSGCASSSSQPAKKSWFHHLPDFYDKTHQQRKSYLNTEGNRRFEECSQLLKTVENAEDYCFMWGYQTTDTANGDQFFPYDYSLWEYLDAIGMGEHVPLMQQEARLASATNNLDEVQSFADWKRERDAAAKSSKTSSTASKTVKKSTPKPVGPVPKKVGVYTVHDDIKEHADDGIIKSERKQAPITLPGE